jgi:precorrin-6B methylase 2
MRHQLMTEPLTCVAKLLEFHFVHVGQQQFTKHSGRVVATSNVGRFADRTHMCVGCGSVAVPYEATKGDEGVLRRQR